MTQEFIDTIYLFSCGATGIKPKFIKKINIEEIYRQSVKQGVWYVTFQSIKYLYETGDLYIDSDIFKKLKNQAIVAISKNTNRLLAIHKLMRKFENCNIKYCILKGEVLSYLYHNPDLRISGDTDILIDDENKEQIIKLLKESGFDIAPEIQTSHHIIATHPVAGIVELHLSMYEDLLKDIWFDDKVSIQEPYRKVRTFDGIDIPTLGITDGLIFITLHYIKHFLAGGVGIRQMVDVLLYMNKYNDEIDWKRFNNLMEHLKYRKFVEHSIGIGIKYLNFKEDRLPKFVCDDNIIIEILHSMEQGGVFGHEQEERTGFYAQYTQARFHKYRKENYHFYIFRNWWYPNLNAIIFPHIKTLIKRYPYLRRSLILYPVAWLHRAIDVVIRLFTNKRSINRYIKPGDDFKNSDVAREHMDLINSLDMI